MPTASGRPVPTPAPWIITVLLAGLLPALRAAEPWTGTMPWTDGGDPAADMVAGIDRYLDREARSREVPRLDAARAALADPAAREIHRRHLARILGVVDNRTPGRLQLTLPAPEAAAGTPSPWIASAGGIRIAAVQWPVVRSIRGEGLLLLPAGTPLGDIIALPDCDTTPEASVGLVDAGDAGDRFPLALAAAGFRVLVPGTVDRGTRWSGNPPVRSVRHSQRETLWRAGYEVGRHPLGQEVQQVLAAADALRADAPDRPLGLAGHGEGGVIALVASVLDDRFHAVAAGGAFGLSETHALLPVYRNAWSLLTRWGDAELAALATARVVILEHGAYPEVRHTDAHGGAPGILTRPSPETFAREWARSRSARPDPGLEQSEAGPEDRIGPDTRRRLRRALLGRELPEPAVPVAEPIPGHRPTALAEARSERLYRQLLEDTQHLMREAQYTREAYWRPADRGSVEAFVRTSTDFRTTFRDEVVGMIPPASLPPAPRSRLLWETNGIRGYEVRLEVHPDVFATGILALPMDIPAGERRPVVVCQHGLEGRPRDVADPFTDHPAYHRYAFRLAQEGYITFSPQNPYIGGTTFRQVLRKAQPLGLTLWSFIVRQHEVITEWLAGLDAVDPGRIAFYGLSYGGKTAMRVPVLVDRYCLSICSADYNEWIWKNTSARAPYSYLWTSEYDMPEWNLANRFNYAELSWLIFPRPFMVERGHDDGVAPDEWVAYEYARTRRHYVKLGLADRTRIEFFDGPHTIHGVGTFAFLRQHLGFPRP